jgi:hypothetical protein
MLGADSIRVAYLSRYLQNLKDNFRGNIFITIINIYYKQLVIYFKFLPWNHIFYSYINLYLSWKITLKVYLFNILYLYYNKFV